MKQVTNSVRIGKVRRRSISPYPNEDQASSIVRQGSNCDLVRKQPGGRRISRSAPLRDDIQDQRYVPKITNSVKERPYNGTNRVHAKQQQHPNMPMSSLGLYTQSETRNMHQIPSTAKWSLQKKILVGSLAALAIAAVITVPIVLGILLTRSTGTSATSTTTVSPTVITAYWSFDNTVADYYGVYNGQLINGAGFSPVSTSQPYVGSGRALFTTTSLNQSFLVSNVSLDLSFKSFTIEAWIYPTMTSNDRGIFGQCQCGSCPNQCFYLLIRSTKLLVGFTLNDLYSATVLSASWYHVAFVYNYQTQQQILYLNGFQDTISSNAQPYQGTNGSIQIGSSQIYLGTNFFNGLIDNVMVTTRAKSAAEILRDASLMAYYSFDLPSPTQDNGPNGLNGVWLNAVTVLGRVNYGIRFTGSPAYFQAYGFYQVPYGVAISKPFSISLWINPTSISSSTIVQFFGTTFTSSSCMNLLGIYSASGSVAQIIVTSATNSYQAYLTGPFITSNTWTHISLTYGTTNGYSLYVNGVYSGSSGFLSYGWSNTLANLCVGYYNTCSYGSANTAFQGLIDEVYVHNRELTQSDVTALANP